MAVVGRACLIIAFAVTLYGIGAAVHGARPGNRRFAESARRAVYATAGYEESVSTLQRVSLTSDMVFGEDGGAHQLGTVSGSADAGYTVTLNVPVQTA